MDTVCPATVNFAGVSAPALTNGTTLDATNRFTVLPAYNPSTLTTRPSYSIGSSTFTASIFSVTDKVASLAGRYTLPTTAGEYWSKTRSNPLTTSELNSYYTFFTTNNVPTKTYKYISTTQELKNALTGNVTEAKVSVSYDLMYSLQYEFCFYARIYSILIKDYLKLLGVQVSATGYTQDIKNDEIRKVVNALNAVNLRMTDITNITNNINAMQRDSISQMNTDVNKFMRSISNASDILKSNAEALTSNDVKSKLRTRMLEFSEEKNAYANQLLGLYGFANLIALGLLFYIYRS